MEPRELKERFSKARVLVLGDLMLDEYLMGNVSRISPEAPVPVLDVKLRKHVAGGAANVAVNIRALDGAVSLIGLISDDSAGGYLRDVLTRWGVCLEGIVNGGARGTICKTRIVAAQQQIVRIDHEDRTALESIIETALLDSVRLKLPDSDLCVLSDYAKGTLSMRVCLQVIKIARELGKPVIVDPKGQNFEKYQGCFVITPNVHEAAAATGQVIDNHQSLIDAGRRLMLSLPGSKILITRGAEGMTLFSEGDQSLTIPALARQVFDVVGAGDTVVATLALGLSSGLSFEASMRLANVAASIVVGKPGTATTNIEEIVAHEEYDRVLKEVG